MVAGTLVGAQSSKAKALRQRADSQGSEDDGRLGRGAAWYGESRGGICRVVVVASTRTMSRFRAKISWNRMAVRLPGTAPSVGT